MQTYLIYLVTNKINQKMYVGQTKMGRLDRRILEHLLDARQVDKNVAFHNALNKYGIDNFTVDIIEDNIPEELIDEREQYWIAYYNTYIHAEDSRGYNETLGGHGMRGYVFTDEDRQKMSIAQKKYWADLPKKDPEEYARLCEIRRQNKLKYVWTDESRKKLSETVSAQYKAGLRQPSSGKPGIKTNKTINKSAHEQSETNSGETQQIPWNRGSSTLPNICQFDLATGKLLTKYTNSRLAIEAIVPDLIDNVKKILVMAGRVFSICKANKGHAYGYIWRFDSGIEELDAETLIREHKSPRAKAILQYDLEHNLIAEYESAAAYSKLQSDNYAEQRLIARNINGVCHGDTKTYKGFIWKYKD